MRPDGPIFYKLTVQLLKPVKIVNQNGGFSFSYMGVSRSCNHSGPKHRFCKNVNKICPMAFFIALSPYNDSDKTYIQIVVFCKPVLLLWRSKIGYFHWKLDINFFYNQNTFYTNGIGEKFIKINNLMDSFKELCMYHHYYSICTPPIIYFNIKPESS